MRRTSTEGTDVAINFNSTSGGANISTDLAGPAGGGPMGMDTSFFEAMARRAAERRKEERDYQRARLEAQDKMQRGDYNERMRERGIEQQSMRDRAEREGEAFDRQKQAEDAPVFVGELGQGGQGLGVTEAMPWQKGAAVSGFSRRDIDAMKPQNAGFEPGAGAPGMVADELADQRAMEARRKAQRDAMAAADPTRQTAAQAGWGLG